MDGADIESDLDAAGDEDDEMDATRDGSVNVEGEDVTETNGELSTFGVVAK